MEEPVILQIDQYLVNRYPFERGVVAEVPCSSCVYYIEPSMVRGENIYVAWIDVMNIKRVPYRDQMASISVTGNMPATALDMGTIDYCLRRIREVRPSDARSAFPERILCPNDVVCREP